MKQNARVAAKRSDHPGNMSKKCYWLKHFVAAVISFIILLNIERKLSNTEESTEEKSPLNLLQNSETLSQRDISLKSDIAQPVQDKVDANSRSLKALDFKPSPKVKQQVNYGAPYNKEPTVIHQVKKKMDERLNLFPCLRQFFSGQLELFQTPILRMFPRGQEWKLRVQCEHWQCL